MYNVTNLLKKTCLIFHFNTYLAALLRRMALHANDHPKIYFHNLIQKVAGGLGTTAHFTKFKEGFSRYCYLEAHVTFSQIQWNLLFGIMVCLD